MLSPRTTPTVAPLRVDRARGPRLRDQTRIILRGDDLPLAVAADPRLDPGEVNLSPRVQIQVSLLWTTAVPQGRTLAQSR